MTRISNFAEPSRQLSTTPPTCRRRMPVQDITPWTPARAAAALLRVMVPVLRAPLPARLNRRA